MVTLIFRLLDAACIQVPETHFPVFFREQVLSIRGACHADKLAVIPAGDAGLADRPLCSSHAAVRHLSDGKGHEVGEAAQVAFSEPEQGKDTQLHQRLFGGKTAFSAGAFQLHAAQGKIAPDGVDLVRDFPDISLRGALQDSFVDGIHEASCGFVLFFRSDLL